MVLLKALRYKAPPPKKKRKEKTHFIHIRASSFKTKVFFMHMLAAFLGNVTCKYMYIQVK